MNDAAPGMISPSKFSRRRAGFHCRTSRWARGIIGGLYFLIIVGQAAAQELADVPYAPTDSVVKGTVAGLSDPFEEVVVLAIRDLADWRQVEVAAEILKRIGPDVSAVVRDQVFRYFIRLGPLGRPCLPEVVKQLADPDPHFRARVLSVVLAAGSARDFLPLKNKNPEVRAGALTALREIGPKAVRPNLDPIARALLDRSELVRGQALLALPLAGDTLERFPFRVRDVYAKADPGVRSTLLKALAVIVLAVGVTDDSIAQGREALHSASADQRMAMASVAGQFGSENGARLLPDLLELSKDKDSGVCGAAIVALRAFASDASTRGHLRAALRPLLKNPDAVLRWVALDTIHELDPGQDANLVSEIAALLGDDDRSVQEGAVRTLGAAGPAAKPFLVQIIRFFTDDPTVHPYAAARTVRQVGPLDAPQLTSLFHPLYVYSDLLPAARLTAHAASAGERDGQILILLLGKSRVSAGTVVAKEEVPHALEVLSEALKAPLLHPALKQEIEQRMDELKALNRN